MGDDAHFIGVFVAESIEKENTSYIIFPAVRRLWKIYTPIPFFLGVPGNFLVILVLQRRQLRGVVAIFLIAISVFNILMLTVDLTARWAFYVLDYNLRTTSYYVCIVHRWVVSFSQSCASWLLVIVTAIQLFFFTSSIKMYRCFTESKVRLLIIAVIVILMVLELVMLHLRSVTDNMTNIAYTSGRLRKCTLDYSTVAAWIRHSIATYLPCFALFVLTFMLYKHVESDRAHSVYKSRMSLSVRLIQSSFTKILVLTNMQFLFTNLPFAIYFSFCKNAFDVVVNEGKELNEIMVCVMFALFYTGQAVNVVIYYFSVARFRRELKHVVMYTFCGQKLQDKISKFRKVSRYARSTTILKASIAQSSPEDSMVQIPRPKTNVVSGVNVSPSMIYTVNPASSQTLTSMDAPHTTVKKSTLV